MSKLYAVALALLVLAVPAMAVPETANMDINITVEPMASLWQEANLTSIGFLAGEAAPWHGRIVELNILGNYDFTVSAELDPASMPANVDLWMITNPDESKWTAEAVSFSDPNYAGTQLWTEDPGAGKSDLNYFATVNSAVFKVKSLDTPDVADIYTYTATNPTATQTMKSLFCIYSWHTMPQFGSGAATVEYTVTPTP